MIAPTKNVVAAHRGMPASKPPLLIVGAGPAGLFAALILAKNGIKPRIIDREPKYHIGSRGAGLQARTLELFQLIGILPDVQARAIKEMPRRAYRLPGGTEVIETVWISPPVDPTPWTPYTDMWLMSQANTEGILRAHLAKYGVQVELATEVRSLEQTADHVTVHIVKHDGANDVEETATYDWVIGTDGGRSVVRRQLGISFVGTSHQDEGLVVGEIEVEGLDRTYWHHWGDMSTKMVMLRPTELLGIFYLAAGGKADYHILETDRDALVNFIYEATDRRDLKFGAIPWIGVFRPNVRMVDRFGEGRVFIAGDSAHIHSPTGGQGLNSSVQDAFNLTWKLSLVIKGLSPPSLLSSYTAERVPVIRSMLKYTTDLLEKLAVARADVPGSQKAAWTRGRELQQLGVNYRWSTIVVDERAPPRTAEELKAEAYGGPCVERDVVWAGDRVRDAPGLRGADVTRLFDIFGPDHHTILIFAPAWPAEKIEAVTSRLASLSPGLVRVLIVYPRGASSAPDAGNDIVLVDGAGHAYAAYGVDENAGEVAIIIVRPDAVVGGVVFGLDGVKKYFSNVFTEEVVKM